MRVLILKMEAEAERIKTGLGNFGHNFLFAPSLEAAHRVLKENDVDLIIAPSNFCDHKSLSIGHVGSIPLLQVPVLNSTAINEQTSLARS